MQTLESWHNPRDGSLMRVIPAGPFTMGSTPAETVSAQALDRDGVLFALRDETPQFRAQVPAFSIGVYAVTNKQFAAFLTALRPPPPQLELWIPVPEQIIVPRNDTKPYRTRRGFESHPAIHISWFGAQAYCRWAGLRLPTEIEWEKAARGDDARIFPWGNSWESHRLCWWGSHMSDQSTSPVHAFENGCSAHGIFQMAGNVEEWCADSYQRKVYQRYATGDLHTPASGIGRVVRGATCLRGNRLEFRCAKRRSNSPSFTNILYTGIRCASDSVSRPEPGGAARVLRLGHYPK